MFGKVEKDLLAPVMKKKEYRNCLHAIKESGESENFGITFGKDNDVIMLEK